MRFLAFLLLFPVAVFAGPDVVDTENGGFTTVVREGTMTNGKACVYDSTGDDIDCAADFDPAGTDNSTDVTLTGEDYLSLSGQEITGLAINPDNLAPVDFGDFSCNGTTCSLDVGGGIDVTLSGQDYLSLTGQEITAAAINPDNLAATDFGDFSCNGTTCGLDVGVSDGSGLGINIPSPEGGEDIMFMVIPQASTFNSFGCIAEGTTPSITVDIKECNSTGASCVSSLSSAITANGGFDAGTITDSNLDANDVMRIVLGTPSGTVTQVFCTLEITAQ